MRRLAIVDHPSPNHGPRPAGAGVRFVVLHYTGMASGRAALRRLCDPASGVSAHYVIDEAGTILRLVPDERRAWHAGQGAWQDCTDLNSHTLGIELIHPGHDFGYRPFAGPQIDALCRLLEQLLVRYRLAPAAVIAHSDLAPRRKRDPGEFFPWRTLARRGLAFWPEDPGNPMPVDPLAAWALLQRLGYRPELAAIGFAPALRAFQRRFRPQQVDGVLDPATMGRLVAVVRALLADSGASARVPGRAPGRLRDRAHGR